MRNIFIYLDRGVDKTLAKILSNQFEKDNCIFINAKEVIQAKWLQSAHLFVIPGGRDIHYVSRLQPKGTDIIRNYTENGGNFLGICAGAYFASDYVEFDVGGSLEVLGKRELSFFNGKAIGPLFGPFYYHSNKSQKTIPVSYNDKKNSFKAMSHYNGGCYFEKIESDSYSVLARYSNEHAAIVKCRVKKGIAILSGVHFEKPLNVESEEKRKLLMSTVMKQFEESTL